MSRKLTTDAFLLRVLEEPDLPGVPTAIELSVSWYGVAPYCGEGTCMTEMACVQLTVEGGGKWFQLREFADWMRKYGPETYGDPIDDDGWESESVHWCRFHRGG